ncbi:MAG: PKD domain-containing protein [Ignavibacteriales bacterium]|nr:PKD domain-containing protein [Ignavibacteriales bacterium]
MKNLSCSLPVIAILLSILSFGCEDSGVAPHLLPSVISFSAGPRNISEGQAVQFSMRAAAELGLARGIIDFRDGTKRDTVNLSGSRDSAQTSHTYLVPGIFKPTLTLEDASGRRAMASDSVYVRVNQLPQIISGLGGTEGLVSRAWKKGLAYDPEQDSMTFSVSPLSPGLVFQLNASNDSVIYYLTNRDENGSKRGLIRVVDHMNRTIEKVINLDFAPRDDISGRVRERFEGTYLASYRPAVVMQGSFTGWVEATSDWESVKVPVDADGKYTLPKLASTKHTLRAFITNGRDSSFVATSQVSPGDQTIDFRVETNAGTGMPLYRLLSLYQNANFRQYRWGVALVGMDLKSSASSYQFYLVCRNITSSWLTAKSFTTEQQNWLVEQIQSRCFAHLPPANRPRIVKGGANDPVPLNEPFSREVARPLSGYMIVYANLLPWRNDLTIWEAMADSPYDCARITLDGGEAPAPPYGFSVTAIVQMIGKTISGNGSMLDQYYNDKTMRAENTVLDSPSIADMKLDWQVIFETPKFNNNVEAKYFVLPQ